MSIDKLEPFLGDVYQSRPDLKFLKYLIKVKKPCLRMTGWFICDTHIWTEIDLESYVRNYYVHRQVRAVYRWSVPIKIRFEIFKYLIKEKKNLFMDDRIIICDTHIRTEIDLESHVRNYYVHRQVRAVFRWRVPIQTRFEIFEIFNLGKKNLVYGWQDNLMWYPHMNRNWFGVIC